VRLESILTVDLGFKWFNMFAYILLYCVCARVMNISSWRALEATKPHERVCQLQLLRIACSTKTKWLQSICQ
jgi:hypothetical protein